MHLKRAALVWCYCQEVQRSIFYRYIKTYANLRRRFFCGVKYFFLSGINSFFENFLVRGFFLKILVFGTIKLFAARQYNVERSAGGYAKGRINFFAAKI